MKEAGNLCSEICENPLHIMPFVPLVNDRCSVWLHGLVVSQGQKKELSYSSLRDHFLAAGVVLQKDSKVRR